MQAQIAILSSCFSAPCCARHSSSSLRISSSIDWMPDLTMFLKMACIDIGRLTSFWDGSLHQNVAVFQMRKKQFNMWTLLTRRCYSVEPGQLSSSPCSVRSTVRRDRGAYPKQADTLASVTKKESLQCALKHRLCLGLDHLLDPKSQRLVTRDMFAVEGDFSKVVIAITGTVCLGDSVELGRSWVAGEEDANLPGGSHPQVTSLAELSLKAWGLGPNICVGQS